MKKLSIPFIFLFAIFLIACEKDSNSTLAGSDSQGGSLARFAVVGNQLYTVSINKLAYYDITEEKNPILNNNFYIGNDIETIYPLNNNLFIGTQSGMKIFDITNPNTLSLLSTYQHIRSCDPVVADENTAFITLNSASLNCSRGLNQLEVIDIKDKTKPKVLNVYPMSKPWGLALGVNRLFVCDGNIKRYEITPERSLVFKESISTSAKDLILRGNILIAIGDEGLKQYDVSGTKAQLLSEIKALK